MTLKSISNWYTVQLSNYNLFIPDENDYEEDDDEPQNPIIVTRTQRYATRIYIPLLIITLYILFFIVLINPETLIITVSNITPSLFNQLRLEHAETLSCPCSTTNVLYSDFVFNTISLHPVCSSIFISKQWINSLYLSNASAFLVMDFRTTAYSQFELLAGLCSFFQETVSQIQVDLNNSQLITVQLLSNNEVQSQINGSIELVRTSASVQATSSLQFLQVTNRLNSLISALNTNAATIIIHFRQTYTMYARFTAYNVENAAFFAYTVATCNLINSITPAGFYSSSYEDSAVHHWYWPTYETNFEPIASTKVDGFFGACNPFNALLASTLDCLYNISCLEQFSDYFPALNKMNTSWMNVLSFSNQRNVSLNDSLSTMLIEEWSTVIDYEKYFAKCAPLSCTYSEKDQFDFSYMITLVLSLYGGLISILRLISLSSVHMAFKFKLRLINPNFNIAYNMARIGRFIRWMKKLNMFKHIQRRTTNDIKEQRVTTRLYLISYAGSIVILLLFTSLSYQTTTIIESSPSLPLYKYLHGLHQDTLECPCSNVTMPYLRFVSLDPVLHQICSSDFVNDLWISMMRLLNPYGDRSSWYGLGAQHLQLLAALCEVANNTIDDGIRRFIMRPFVTSNVLQESNFIAVLNITINQLIQSMIINFQLLLDTSHLFNQVDQPFTTLDNQSLTLNSTINQSSDQASWQLSIRLNGLTNDDQISIDCICATNPQCQSSVVTPNWQNIVIDGQQLTAPYVLPGMIAGCFVIDSLLLSTLECFYSNFCLSVLYNNMNSSFNIGLNRGITWFNTESLIYQSTSSIFPPNTTVSVIVKQMLVEQWNPFFSFDRYYNACAPVYCKYTQIVHKNSFLQTTITLISTIGGLAAALHLIIPHLIKIIFRLFRPKARRQEEGNLSQISRQSITYLYSVSH